MSTLSERERLIQRLIHRDGDHCHYCGIKLEGNVPQVFNPNGISVDHVIPQVQGGKSRIENLVLACRRCNREKMTAHYHEFRFAKETDLVLRFIMDGEL